MRRRGLRKDVVANNLVLTLVMLHFYCKSSSALQRFLFIFTGSFILFNTARGQGSLRQFVGRKAPNQAIIAPITTT